jgi:DNA-binding LacI/PurR family transcriptional regulator
VAGVSQAAVSRAFTSGASIAETTREKVFQAAKTLGYRPNLIARSLIKGESGIIGVIIGNPRNPLFMSALDMLLARLSQQRKHCLVFMAGTETTADAQVEDLLNYRVDALVLVATTLSPKMMEQCRAEGIRTIFLNRKPRNSKDFTVVTSNNRDGAEQIAKHLLDQGYRRLAFMAGRLDSSTTRDREAGFTSYLKSQGLPAPEQEIGHFQRQGAIEAARRLLTRTPRPDAIFCANDYMAIATMEIAKYEFGLEVGREIGIAGFDDIEQAAWPSFDLTTYSLPLETLIETVAEMLSAPAGVERLGATIIKGDLKMRGSTQRSKGSKR